ncbi:MAG TPA: response regulator [Thermomicrobiales bacterium]|nr:response regulator [Thermomicrobiales bacterium]
MRARQVSSGPHSILVVDDERPIVAFIRDLLEDEGYLVTPAFDGREAIEILRRDPPELVISDVLMPGASGHDVVHFVSSRPEKIAPKVILMSANLNRSPRKHIPLLRKPFDVDELLDLVGELLDEPIDERSA